MPRKPRKRTRKKQKGGVNFRNILSAQNEDRLMPFDSKVDDFNLYRYAHDYIYPRRRNLTPYALPAGPPEEDPFINIRIIPMPWISRAKASIENDGELGYPTYYPLQLSRFAKVGQVRGYGYNQGVILSEDYGGYVDTDYPEDDFPFIIAHLTDYPAAGRSIWNHSEIIPVLLRIPRNTQEVIDTLHGDRSHHIDYLVEVIGGHDTTGQISRIADLRRERMNTLYEDKPDEPDKYTRANESIIRLQSRARGRNTRKKTKGLSSRRGVWEPTRNPREQMRRWTDMSKNVMEDDPMRGYEQFRIYDPIRGYQNEEIEPYDKRFLETYDRLKNIR